MKIDFSIKVRAIFCVACVLVVLCAQTVAQESREIERGTALEERGEFAQAKAVYLSGLGQFPKSGELNFRVGAIYLRESDWPHAIQHLERASAPRPRHVETLYYLAQAYYLDGQQHAALETIRRAARLAPDRPEVAQKYGEYLCEMNRRPEGLRYLLKAQRLDPQPVSIICKRSRQDFDGGLAIIVAETDFRVRGGRRQKDAPAIFRHLDVIEMRPPLRLDADRGAQVDILFLKIRGAHLAPPVQIIRQPFFQRASQSRVFGEIDVIRNAVVEIHMTLRIGQQENVEEENVGEENKKHQAPILLFHSFHRSFFFFLFSSPTFSSSIFLFPLITSSADCSE